MGHANDDDPVAGDRALHFANDVGMAAGDGFANGGMDIGFVNNAAAHDRLVGRRDES